MRRAAGSLSVLVGVGLALRVWAAFGALLVPGSEVDPTEVLADRALAFGFYVLWIPVLAITYQRDPRGRMWKLILLSFVMDCWWVFGYLRNPFAGIGWTLQTITQPIAAVVVAHMVLAFPSGRLHDRTDRWLLGVAYTIVVPVMVLRYAVLDPPFPVCQASDTWCGANILLVTRNDDLAFLLGQVGYLAPPLAALASVEVIRHWRRASAAGRRALAPFAFGMPLVFGVLGIIWLAPTMGPSAISDFIGRYKLFDVTSFLTPTLFLVGILRVRLARGSLADLALELGRGVPLGGLRDALARTLRDPTLQLAFAAPTGSGLVDADGQPFDIDPAGDRSATRLEHDGSLVAVLVHDPAIDREDKGLVEAVGSVARLALDNERLSAQVRAQLEEVRASRQRIVEAGDAERRRVERDLHDGAQQRLVALAMRLEAARGSGHDEQALIDGTTAELAVAIAEVRHLARGLHPAILSEAGLNAAIESLAVRTPIPVEVHAEEVRYPDAAEATAYFVVAEALTNVARYASATHATVTVRATDAALLVDVRDDGIGGADASGGSGLRGLQDRVAAVGGTFEVESPHGGGTLVRAVIPVPSPAAE
jgi:signal transduction histidine kinase